MFITEDLLKILNSNVSQKIRDLANKLLEVRLKAQLKDEAIEDDEIKKLLS